MTIDLTGSRIPLAPVPLNDYFHQASYAMNQARILRRIIARNPTKYDAPMLRSVLLNQVKFARRMNQEGVQARKAGR